MISRFSVKKPLTVIMALLMVILLGYVSFTNMKTDLLPNMDLPYVAIITTYVGASPEKVEQSLTKPLEQSLATTSGVENMTSVSAENYSMILLEFSRSANLDSAIIEMSSKANQITGALGASVSTPMYMKINPDMIPVTIASVDIEGLDRYEVAKRVEEDIIPEFERIDGVASVSAEGLIENTIRITINQDMIDDLNDEILNAVDAEMLEAEEELEKAQKELDKGLAEFEKTRDEQNKTLSEAGVLVQAGMTQLLIGKNTTDSLVTALKTAEGIIESADDLLKQAGKEAEGLRDYRPEIEAGMVALRATLVGAQGTVDGTIELLHEDTEGYEEIKAALKKVASKLDKWIDECDSAIEQISETKTPSEAISEVSSLLKGVKKECKAARVSMQDTAAMLYEQYDNLAEQMKTIEEGKLLYAQEMAVAKAKLDDAQAQLDAGRAEFEKAKQSAYEQAGLSGAITVETISSLISAENFSMPVGSISDDNVMYAVKVGELFEDDKELIEWELFNIPVGDIGVITLEDIADIEYLDNSEDMYAKVNGNNGILLTFAKQSTYSTTDVAHSIQDKIKTLENEYQGLSVTALSDQGEYIDLVIDSVLEALIMGGILAVLVLLVFLKAIKPTLIIAISIPASILFAVVLMYFTGVSLNIISLAGLALGVGMLVDNSIVVVENIYRLKSLGMPIKQAAIDGAKQVSGAIVASTLTTVSVFLPIVFTEGITRQIFADMGLTITYSLVASLVVALTLVPALSSMMLKKTEEKKVKTFDAITNGYTRALGFALRKKSVVLIPVVLLLALSVFGVTQMGTEFIPESDMKQMGVSLEMPIGSSAEETREMCELIISRISEIDDIDTIAAMQTDGGTSSIMSMGSGSSHRQASIYLLLDEDREMTSQDVAVAITNMTDDLDCTVTVSSSNMSMSMLTGEGVQIIIKGSELDDLKQVATDIGDMLRSIEGTTEVTTGLEETTQEIRIKVDKNEAMANGYTVAQVYMAVSKAITSESTATTLTVENNDYDVIVADSEQNLVTPDELANIELDVLTQAASSALQDDDTEPKTIKLSEIASIEYTDTPNSISHDNQMRTMTVSASIDVNHNVGKVSREIEKKLDSYNFPGDCYYEVGGEDEYITSALEDLVYMLLIAIAFIYMIMVAQFQSLKSPFIVMFTIPLAFTGGILFLWSLGFNLSVVAMLGFLVLSGVVVNNGIVFVDYANQLVEGGMGRHEALIETGKTRIRPIVMTAITTILGLVTMALGIGEGTDMIQPMGVVVIGGLIYATLLTLFVIPILYDVFNRKKDKKGDKNKIVSPAE